MKRTEKKEKIFAGQKIKENRKIRTEQKNNKMKESWNRKKKKKKETAKKKERTRGKS